jgi:MFS family permease
VKKLIIPSVRSIRQVYFTLLLSNTLAASLIWGINTLFLLQAGLTNTQAFLANSFFTLGQMIFEVPTGMVADVKGRRFSYLLGTITLSLSTAAYLGAWYLRADFWVWAVSSVLLGLGFTFFSGATEAWLVDALKAAGDTNEIDEVLAKGQSVGGAAMLIGSVAGGFIAQQTSLAVPYILRSVILGVTFVLAWFTMRDWGFKPEKSGSLKGDISNLVHASYEHGLKNPNLRWIMLTAPLGSGVGFYAFYAMQPYLLQLYGSENAYGVAGLAAALVAGSQVVGGLLVPKLKGLVGDRIQFLTIGTVMAATILMAIGVLGNFYLVVAALMLWGMVFALTQPVYQAHLNQHIPSNQRATVLSFAALLGSSGGVVLQPGLGKVADVRGYGASFVTGGAISLLALPLYGLALLQEKKRSKV